VSILPSTSHRILMRAHILKVVLDFDRLVSRGKSHHSAVVELGRVPK
jgi:hypothetical protein